MFTIKGFATSGVLKLIDKRRANKENNDSNLRHVAAACVALSRNKVSLCLLFSRRSLHAVCDKQRQVGIESIERPALSGSNIYRGMTETIPKIWSWILVYVDLSCNTGILADIARLNNDTTFLFKPFKL